MIPPMIGVKVAVSDHRSSNPSGDDLIALANGSQKSGLVKRDTGLSDYAYGSGKGRLDPVFYVLDHSDVPAKQSSSDPYAPYPGADGRRRGTGKTGRLYRLYRRLR